MGSVGDSLSAFFGPHFRNLDLPLLIGYEKDYTGFKVAIDAGLIVNLHSIPKEQQRYVYILEALHHSIGLSGYVGLRFTQKLNDRLSLFAAPFYRLQLSARYSPNTAYPQAVNFGGVMLGIKYGFHL